MNYMFVGLCFFEGIGGRIVGCDLLNILERVKVFKYSIK